MIKQISIKILKKVKKILDTKLAKVIAEPVDPILNEFIKKKGHHYHSVTDEKIVFDYDTRGSWKFHTKAGFFTFLMVGVYPWYEGIYFHPWVFPVQLFFGTLSVVAFFYSKFATERFITLDRANGLMTYPWRLFTDEHTARFDDLDGYWLGIQMGI